MMAFEWGCIRRIVLIFCGFVLAGSFSGCAFGPRVLEKTHGRYQESVRQVDEEQLLRNIVHLRYSEVPLALNVSSIATQYELAGAAEARPFFIAPNPTTAISFSGHSPRFCPTSPSAEPIAPPSRLCRVTTARRSSAS